MKRNLLLMCAVFLLLGMGASRALAQDTPSLQDIWFNVNGSQTELSAPGVNLGGYNSSTGLGTITFTDLNVGAGYFNTWWDEEVGVPFYNEFGSTGGVLSDPNESWEIGGNYSSSIFGDAAAGALLDSNLLPEGASDFGADCGTWSGGVQTDSTGCNGDATTALGYSFNVSSGDEEIVTLKVSQTAPSSGFYLQQTNPNEDGNGVIGNVYFSLSATQQPTGNQPPPTPEPSTWLLMLTGLAAGAVRLRRRFQFKVPGKLLSGLAVLIAGLVIVPFASAQSVNTVPWDPTNPAAPHTAYPGATIVLGAIFNPAGSADSFTYVWNYGDGTPVGSATALTNPNDISSRHIYAGTSAGQTWTAVVTVTDTTTSAQYSGNYLVIWEPPPTNPAQSPNLTQLQWRVNVAIDWGLWFLHQSMYHPAAGQGNWANCASGYNYACGLGYGSVTASNVQAFEVNGHLATGPATDPYTSDVAEGLASIWTYLTPEAVASKTYTYNTATNNYGCSDGTAPLTSGACDGTATKVYYNPGGINGGTYTFDGNSNGKAIYAYQSGNTWGYEDGQYADAIVASGNPAGVATAGSVSGETYKDIVQDIADAAAYCQYPGDSDDVENGYTRGSNAYQGGGWWYGCQQGGDNSVSQWASIGLIGAQRGFGLSIPKIVTDANNMWITASQDVQASAPEVNNPSGNSYTDAYGAYGYNGSLYYSDPWGPYALTPSGMVQMSLDGVGRTANTAFGAASNAPDQRFNNAETFYADNFCNPTSDGPVEAPRAYTYGMFSFTKSMLLHNPLGALTPIQYLRTQTPGVFTTNASVPANTIDWYAALSATNGGSDPCDGIAQTIIQRQYGPNNAPNAYGQNYSTTTPGFWFYDNYYSYQNYYETAWSIIMLQRTVFVNCVNNLTGAGTASGASQARVDLTWTGIPNVTAYDVLRGTSPGGPYTQVGSTTNTAYSDRTGLTNGDTYYYVLQPVNAAGAVCQSNQATVTVPKPR
ncbi:MAG: PEP-CTERM sorting domain-containing protein [Terracidiphilus sp.]